MIHTNQSGVRPCFLVRDGVGKTYTMYTRCTANANGGWLQSHQPFVLIVWGQINVLSERTRGESETVTDCFEYKSSKHT